MSGYRDSFEPFGKPYDSHTPANPESRSDCGEGGEYPKAELFDGLTGRQLVAVDWGRYDGRSIALDTARRLATRLVAAVGCEQVDELRKALDCDMCSRGRLPDDSACPECAEIRRKVLEEAKK